MNDQQTAPARIALTTDPAIIDAVARATEEVRLARQLLESRLSDLASATKLLIESLKPGD